MPKDATLTVRLPKSLRGRLEARARRERRSLSAQVEYELSRSLEAEAPPRPQSGSMGRFEGSPVPSDADFLTVRKLLWGRLGRHLG